MNKVTKYILGFVVIFIAAVICVFGIIKYEESRDSTSPNNSTNLGGVDGQKADKETTIIIEKLAATTDLDDLKTELNLSDNVVATLKKYSPVMSYAVDDSDNNIYIRHGGYNANKSGIIGVYTVKDGKLNTVNKNSDDKLNDDRLKWINIKIKNTEHDIDAAEKIMKKYFFVTEGKRELNGIAIFGYLSDFSRRIQGSGNISSIVPMSLGEITDIYNTASDKTYNAEQVYNIMTTINGFKYSEVNDSYVDNESKYNNRVGNAEVIYFTKDKMYLAAFGGIGGANSSKPAPKSQWTIDGDRIIIPILGFDNRQTRQYILRLNNKDYEGGAARSKYYIESTE